MDVIDQLLRSKDYVPVIKPVDDLVFVRNVQIQATPGADAWGREKAQPLIVNVRIPYRTSAAGMRDDIDLALDYRTIYKAITAIGTAQDENRHEYQNLTQLAIKLASSIGHPCEFSIDAPKAILHSEGLSLRYLWGGENQIEIIKSEESKDGAVFYPLPSVLAVRALTIPCVIGIGQHERIQKQPVVVDFAIDALTEYALSPSSMQRLCSELVKVIIIAWS
jgi:dihydroneopterin aldolase / 2-amino-4-hydroxy-6-hydroxymethyldihydropteridine diphosphokinase / dihydropteroate synthase